MDGLGLDRAALVGLSLGARVAVETALTHPGRVSALVLSAPTLRGRERSEAVRRFASEEQKLIEGGQLDAAIDLGHQFWLAGPHRRLEDIDPTLRERLAAMERQAYAKVSAATREPGPETPPPDYQLAQLAVPTLVAVGELDVDEVRLSRISRWLSVKGIGAVAGRMLQPNTNGSYLRYTTLAAARGSIREEFAQNSRFPAYPARGTTQGGAHRRCIRRRRRTPWSFSLRDEPKASSASGNSSARVRHWRDTRTVNGDDTSGAREDDDGR